MDNPFLALVWKRPITKFSCLVAKDCTERLSAVALSIGLLIPCGWCVSSHVVRASFFFLRYATDEIPWPRLTEIAWEDAEQGLGMAMSTVASEKNRELFQGIVVYRQRVLQTVTSLGIVSLVFRGHDLLRKKARFLVWKKISFPRERRKWSLGLGQN